MFKLMTKRYIYCRIISFFCRYCVDLLLVSTYIERDWEGLDGHLYKREVQRALGLVARRHVAALRVYIHRQVLLHPAAVVAPVEEERRRPVVVNFERNRSLIS